MDGYLYHIILIFRYFYVLNDGNDLTTEEIEGKGGCNVVAHDGWVKNADPLINFAAPGSLVSELYTCIACA